jgi:hypothetical protein
MAESIIKGRKKRRDYTQIYNSAIKDRRLDLKTLGLFVVMQSFPDDWEYSVSGLAARVRIGRDAIRKCLRQLEDAGYLVREQGHDKNGKFAGNTYVLQEEAPPLPLTENPATVEPENPPLTEKPSTVKPSTEKPLTENRPQVNKHSSNTTGSNPPISPQGDDTVAMFERFWSYYPRHQHKDAALKAWRKLNPDMALCREMSHALLAQVRSEQWTRDDGRYIPLFSTWLNGRYWTDELGPVHTPPTDPAPPDDDERRGRYL